MRDRALEVVPPPITGKSRGQRQHEHWENMRPVEREARVALLVGLWSNPDARIRLSQTMSAIWTDYKGSTRYNELLEALAEAKRGE